MKQSLENRIAKWNVIHNNQYDYSKVVFVNQKVKIIIICKTHGEFSTLPTNHSMGRGCPTCGKNKSKLNSRLMKLAKKFKDVIQPEDHKLIPLSKGKFAIVDNEDFETVKDIAWHVGTWNYALNSDNIPMQNFLLNPPRGKVVDHINSNGLDNRRHNLRIATQQENLLNRRRWGKRDSDYMGVNWNPVLKMWYSCIVHPSNNRRYVLGHFKTEFEAALHYDKFARAIIGEFAYLNFPHRKAV